MKRGMLPFFLDEVFDDLKVPVAFSEQQNSSGVTISEDEEHLYVRAHVPGVKLDQIQVTFEKGVLWIKAESSEEEKGETYLCKANAVFSYRIPIHIRVDDQSVPNASCKDGVLKIAFLKSKCSRPLKIPIKGA